MRDDGHVNGLHFHDLRREFKSRLLESRADLHDVQMFLGHAAIATTSRYLQSTPVRLERALARLEEAADGVREAHDAPEHPEVGPTMSSVPGSQRRPTSRRRTRKMVAA